MASLFTVRVLCQKFIGVLYLVKKSATLKVLDNNVQATFNSSSVRILTYRPHIIHVVCVTCMHECSNLQLRKVV